jgi:hypothetical protein
MASLPVERGGLPGLVVLSRGCGPSDDETREAIARLHSAGVLSVVTADGPSWPGASASRLADACYTDQQGVAGAAIAASRDLDVPLDRCVVVCSNAREVTTSLLAGAVAVLVPSLTIDYEDLLHCSRLALTLGEAVEELVTGAWSRPPVDEW